MCLRLNAFKITQGIKFNDNLKFFKMFYQNLIFNLISRKISINKT